MQIKGLNKIREKLADYPGRRILIIPFKGVIIFIISYLFLLFLDILPRLFGNNIIFTLLEPLIPILGSVFVAAIAYLQIGKMWTKRDAMREKFGLLAY